MANHREILMTLAVDLSSIGGHLEAYHAKTNTSTGFRIYMSDQVVTYAVAIATTGQTYEFKDPAVLIAWLVDINADIDPNGSAMLRQRAEQLQEQKIMREAEELALAKEISELPETQRLLEAQAEAAKVLAAADARLLALAEETARQEDEAAARQAEADAAELIRR